MSPAPLKNEASPSKALMPPHTPPVHHLVAADAKFRQKCKLAGERYASRNYIFWDTISGCDQKKPQVFITYDIACQLRSCAGHLIAPKSVDDTQSMEDDVPELLEVEDNDADD
ncbi:hypothetical protein DFH09DRAFT_1326779 [Mycena vulgaris]|nr:hypothetical protein DFH09DRAFT_1326779 [Mycena vulgaris]